MQIHNHIIDLKDQVDKLTAQVEKQREQIEQLSKLRSYQTAAREKVIKQAKHYALMASFGKYLQDGVLISIQSPDKKMHEERFVEKMKQAAIEMLIEDGLVGSEMK